LTIGQGVGARIEAGLRGAELDPRTLGMAGALAAIWIGLDVASDGLFLAPRNLYNLAVQSSVVGVMASGMVLVITARHIDLSVGSVLAVTGMCIAALQAEILPDAPWAWPLSVLAGLLLGTVIGAWQGWWVAYRGVPAFVVTLGGLLMFRGAAYLVADGRTIAPLATSFGRLGGGLDGSIGATASWALGTLAAVAIIGGIVQGRRIRIRNGFAPRPAWADAVRITLGVALVVAFVGVMNAYTQPRSEIARGIPLPVLIWMGSGLGMAVLLRATRFGRYVTAIGGNPEAAIRAGIDVRRVTLGVFAAMGALAAVAAVITTARLGAGTNSMGTLAELSVIAAAVIGGTSLAGGQGRIGGAVLGAVLMQSLENGMVLLGAESAVRQIAIGGVLIVAVWTDAATRRRGGSA
jgi:D-xylose transport system permease protein